MVVDIKVSVSPQQEFDEFADHGHFPLHHSYMESSAVETNATVFTHGTKEWRLSGSQLYPDGQVVGIRR